MAVSIRVPTKLDRTGRIFGYTFDVIQPSIAAGYTELVNVTIPDLAPGNEFVDMRRAVDLLRRQESRRGIPLQSKIMVTRDEQGSVSGASAMLAAALGDVLVRRTRSTSGLPRIYATGQIAIADPEKGRVGASLRTPAVTGMFEKLSAILEDLTNNPIDSTWEAGVVVLIGVGADGDLPIEMKTENVTDKLAELKAKVPVVQCETLQDALSALPSVEWGSKKVRSEFTGAWDVPGPIVGLALVALLAAGGYGASLAGQFAPLTWIHHHLVSDGVPPDGDPRLVIAAAIHQCDAAAYPLDPDLPVDEHGASMEWLKADAQRLDAAATACTTAIRLAPAERRPKFNLARIEMARGRQTVADDRLRSGDLAGYPMSRYIVADEQLSRGQHAGARAAFEELSKAARPVPPGLLTLANMLACGTGGAQDLPRAEQLIEQAAVVARDNPGLTDFANLVATHRAALAEIKASGTPLGLAKLPYCRFD